MYIQFWRLFEFKETEHLVSLFRENIRLVFYGKKINADKIFTLQGVIIISGNCLI